MLPNLLKHAVVNLLINNLASTPQSVQTPISKLWSKMFEKTVESLSSHSTSRGAGVFRTSKRECLCIFYSNENRDYFVQDKLCTETPLQSTLVPFSHTTKPASAEKLLPVKRSQLVLTTVVDLMLESL